MKRGYLSIKVNPFAIFQMVFLSGQHFILGVYSVVYEMSVFIYSKFEITPDALFAALWALLFSRFLLLLSLSVLPKLDSNSD
jgi:hypothetical protein